MLDDSPPYREFGICGTAAFSSAVSASFEAFAVFDSEGQDWYAVSDEGQSRIAHLDDLYITAPPESSTVMVTQYYPGIEELNPLSGTEWAGTVSGESPPGDEVSIAFSSGGELQYIFSTEGVPSEGGRGRYFVVSPDEVVFYTDEELQEGSWVATDSQQAWGLDFQIVGDDLWIADYYGSVEIDAQPVP